MDLRKHNPNLYRICFLGDLCFTDQDPLISQLITDLICTTCCVFPLYRDVKNLVLFFWQAVSREIRKILTERASNFNIALDDVSITSLTFGKEFTAAIEAKQVAAQEAERAKFVVEKAEQDKRSAVIRAQVSKCAPALAFSSLFRQLLDFQLGNTFIFCLWLQGEAKSAQLIGQAIANNPAFITLRKIEAAREIAHTISNSANRVFLSSDELLLNLQEMNLESAKK